MAAPVFYLNGLIHYQQQQQQQQQQPQSQSQSFAPSYHQLQTPAMMEWYQHHYYSNQGQLYAQASQQPSAAALQRAQSLPVLAQPLASTADSSVATSNASHYQPIHLAAPHYAASSMALAQPAIVRRNQDEYTVYPAAVAAIENDKSDLLAAAGPSRKRRRVLAKEEYQEEKSTGDLHENDGGGSTSAESPQGRHHRRATFTPMQRECLELEFRSTMYLTTDRKRSLARQLGLSDHQVKIWFQNRRSVEGKLRRIREGGEPSVPKVKLPKVQRVHKSRPVNPNRPKTPRTLKAQELRRIEEEENPTAENLPANNEPVPAQQPVQSSNF